MALAASRPLQCAAHMGDHTPHSNVSVALPDLFPSISQESGNREDENVTQAEPLRLVNNSLPSTSISTLPEAYPLAAPACPAVAFGSCISHEDGATRSNDQPSKGAPSMSTSIMTVESESEVAVREEDEGKVKEDDGIHVRRQSPSPSPRFQGTDTRKPLEPALKSALAPFKKGQQHTRTRRRIRGIWGDDKKSHFSQLHDDTLQSILKFLSMKDLCVVTMVCQRWKQIAKEEDFWKRIDASDFVEAAFVHYSKKSKLLPGKTAPNKSTSLELADRLERHSPQTLVIHSIHRRLSADNFLSSLPSLQELTLTSFDALTDTHIHVLLLSSSCKNPRARSTGSCILKKLVLENCNQLTNLAVQSIGKMCPELEELSVKGCPHIKDLAPLRDLWFLSKKPESLLDTAPQKPSAPLALSSMAMLFSPPPPPAAPTPAPRRATTPPSLQSLFAPPGDSPRRASNVISFLPRTRSNGSSVKEPGKLKRLNVCQTGVSAESLVAAVKSVSTGNYVGLQHLLVEGSGESWNDSLLQDLADSIDMSTIQSLNLGCSLVRSSSSRVTDKGLRNLIPGEISLRSLQNLNLSGHSSLTGAGLGEFIAAAGPNLEELILDGCKGISTKSSNAAMDLANCHAFAKAILKCTTRKVANHQSCDDQGDCSPSQGLLRLSLSRCFSNQTQMQKNSNLQIHEESLGNFVLDAIGKKPKAKKQVKSSVGPPCTTPTTAAITGTLQELDLTDCWFVTPTTIASVKKRCPRLHQLHLKGTQADIEN